jgi:ketosteroid isomerase-like protein
MRINVILATIIFLAGFGNAGATNQQFVFHAIAAASQDSSRLLELDAYWLELSRTVKEGDFDGYAAAYHDDAVVVFATGENKRSIPISKALADWKQGFQDTKTGKSNSYVEFRFSQRIGDTSTAHETGIFNYTSFDKSGRQLANSYVHFEMLFIKLNGIWYSLMEYQKSSATKAEWHALK